MKNQFLLSIIIPTKDRQEYAIYAVEQILQINDYRIQVVVQDNSKEAILHNMLSKYKDDIRLKYNYTKGIISFVDNFNLAVNLADGEYICIIGDDDGIIPQIVDVADWARNNHIDAVKPEPNAIYFWPNSKVSKKRFDNGYLIIDKIAAKTRICNPYSEVIKLLKQGGQNYLYLDLVKLYHGIVRKECLEKVKAQTGKYFGGLSPDIYIAVVLSLTIDKVIIIDLPLTISGICNKSGSAKSVTGRHIGKLEDAPHFRGHEKYEWAEPVPRFYSVETIWADSAIAAIKDLNKTDMIKEFNVGALASCCLKRHPEFKDIIIMHYYNWPKEVGNKSIMKLEFMKYKNTAICLTKKIIRRIKRKPGDIVRINGVNNIIEAGKVLQQRFSEIGIDNKRIEASLDKVIDNNKRY